MARVTLRDVAEKAGVSVASVSNVLNGRTEKVTAKTAQRIVDVARELGYAKDFNAAALKTGSSNIALVLMPAIETDDPDMQLMDGSPFFSDLLAGIEKGASVSHLQFSFIRMGHESEAKALLNGPEPQGVIVVGRLTDAIQQVIAEWRFKTIIVDNGDFFRHYSASDRLINFCVDDRVMGELAIEHLINLGHRHLVLLFGALDASSVHQERFIGIQRWLESHGHSDVTLDLVECGVNYTDAQAAFPAVEASLKKGATAVMCMADILALGCYRAASEAGYVIPNDFSLTGMDGLQILQYMPYQLTTVNQQVVQRGFSAVQSLVTHRPIDKPAISLNVGNTTRAIDPE